MLQDDAGKLTLLTQRLMRHQLASEPFTSREDVCLTERPVTAPVLIPNPEYGLGGIPNPCYGVLVDPPQRKTFHKLENGRHHHPS